MLCENFRTKCLRSFGDINDVRFLQKIVVCVNEIYLQKPNMKSIVLQQLKFLSNKNKQTKFFNNQNVVKHNAVCECKKLLII